MKKIELSGANMDIDLSSNKKVKWKQDKCPWDEADGTNKHKCAVKNILLCKYFKGVKYPDKVICIFPKK